MSARCLCHDELTLSCLTMSSNKGADNQDKYKDCKETGGREGAGNAGVIREDLPAEVPVNQILKMEI